MSKKKTWYAVYRLGANRANTEGLVAIVEATSRQEAERVQTHERPTVYDSAWLALAPEVTIWANQRVEAIPLSRASVVDVRAFQEMERT